MAPAGTIVTAVLPFCGCRDFAAATGRRATAQDCPASGDPVAAVHGAFVSALGEVEARGFLSDAAWFA
jgi:hypothetical protein